ncbi:MAG: hypothetical protein ACK5PW_04650, partial [Burkholderiales bacterium]
MQMTNRLIARLSLTLGLALCAGVQAQDLVGSYVKLEAQVVGPAASPTLNSTNDLTGNDWVNWTQYFASRESAPWAADGEQSVPSGHGWRAGQLKAPPNTSVQWKVAGAWLTSEPASGAAVTAVRWHTDPMLKFDFNAVGNSTDFSGTGDGFRTIPYKNNFYVVNHHSYTRQLNCRNANTGAKCPGFPTNGQGLSLTDAGSADNNSRYFTPHYSMEALNQATGELFVGVSASDGSGPVQIVCLNLDTLQGCGSWILASFTNYSLLNSTNLEIIGSKYFVLTKDFTDASGPGILHCFDIVTRTLCGSTSYQMPNTYPRSLTSTQLDGKMFFSSNHWPGASPTRMWCHDPVTAAPCAGWYHQGYQTTTDASYWRTGGAFPIPNSDGTPRGVCAAGGSCRAINGSVFSLSMAARSYVHANMGWLAPGAWWVIAKNFNAVQGSRIYTPRDTGMGVNCFDFATDSVCPGFPRNTSMVDLAYSTRFDPTRPNCLLVIGDSAVGYQFNVNTLGACSDPGLSTEPKTLQVTPANYYKCDPTNAQVTGWDAVRVSPTLTWGGLSGLSE